MEAQVLTQSPTTWFRTTQLYVLARKYVLEDLGKMITRSFFKAPCQAGLIHWLKRSADRRSAELTLGATPVFSCARLVVNEPLVAKHMYLHNRSLPNNKLAKMKTTMRLILLVLSTIKLYGQQPVSASFVATLGTDTVIVETYNMLANHLYGRAFLRYPEDQIGVFDFHFYPDGSIQHYSMSFMKPDSSFLTSRGTHGVFCRNDTCTWFASEGNAQTEYTNERPVKHMDFILSTL